ncbi:hypothetical protein UJ101_01395 [Flavobacteriaceae bacterium UJ101]|nr:hypothetical protein UJ101_01395 [Flavobacteriaceae bacterium UJ101]
MTLNQKGFLYVFLMSLAWALNVVVAGYSIVELKVNAFVYGGQTLLTAAILFGITILLKNQKVTPLKFTQKDVIWMLLLGVLANGIGNYFGLQGIENSPTNYAFLVKTSIVFAISLEILLGQQKFSVPRVLLGILLLLGAYLISTNGKLIIPQKEDTYTLIAAACFGSVSVLSKTINRRNSPEHMALFRSIAGGVVLFGIAFFLGENILRTEAIEWGILGGVLVFLLFLFLYKTLEIKSASYLSMMSMMFSVMVALLQYSLFGVTLGSWQIIGATIIILAVILLEIYSQKKEKRFS